jgi:transcriptional regulator with XRE-family HTH domain
MEATSSVKEFGSANIPVDRATVRRLRQNAGLTQKDLAARAGITENHVWQIEAGRRPVLRPPTVHRLAGALGVEIDDLRLAAPTDGVAA